MIPALHGRAADWAGQRRRNARAYSQFTSNAPPARRSGTGS